MRAQQPRHYALFNRVEDLIPVLMPPIEVSARDRGTISFFSNAWSPAMVQEFVRDRFVPLLRA